MTDSVIRAREALQAARIRAVILTFILTLLLTGRRRSEVLRLTAGDIEPGEPAFYRYRGSAAVRRGQGQRPRASPIVKRVPGDFNGATTSSPKRG